MVRDEWSRFFLFFFFLVYAITMKYATMNAERDIKFFPRVSQGSMILVFRVCRFQTSDYIRFNWYSKSFDINSIKREMQMFHCLTVNNIFFINFQVTVSKNISCLSIRDAFENYTLFDKVSLRKRTHTRRFFRNIGQKRVLFFESFHTYGSIVLLLYHLLLVILTSRYSQV